MKKFKVLLFFLSAFVILSFNNYEASAAEDSSNDDASSIDYDNNLQITESDGSIIFFDNQEDMEAHLDYMKSIDENPGIAPLAIGETLVGTQYKKMQFLGYSKFTPSWTYANSYQLVNNQSETFSSKVNTDWGDVGISFSKSYGVNTTIPANSKKLSRLGGYADIKVERYRVSLPNVSSSYYKNVAKTTATYVIVKYK